MRKTLANASLCAALVYAALVSLGCSSAETGGTPSGSTGAGSGLTTGVSGSSGNGTQSGATSSVGSTGGGAASGTNAASGTAMSGASGSLMSGASGNPMSGASGSPMSGASGSVVGPVDTVSVLERNGHGTRDGYFTAPALTKAKVKTMALDAGFKATFTGTMYASPLYLDKGPGGKGIFIAVTAQNDIFALDETDGHTVWTKNVGPAPKSACGPVPIVGLESTPAIDPTPGPDGFGTIYAAGAIGPAFTHQLYAFSAKDGSMRTGWPVNISMIQTAAATAAGIAFKATNAAQRGSISLVNGIVYVPYGSYYDCDPYRGWVVAVNTADPTKTGAWVSRGAGEAIWAAGGMASDGNGVIAVTGNSKAGKGMHLDGEQVMRVTGLATFDSTNKANYFYPTGANAGQPLWATMDGSDADFGSNSPAIVPVGGKNYVAAVSKNGHLFVLDAANLGGTDVMGVPAGGGYLRVSGEGMQSHTAMATYTSSKGAHVVFSTQAQAGCPNGGGTGIMSVAVAPGPPMALSVAWCAPLAAAGGGGGGAQTSAISTTSDGKGADSIVWFVSGAALVALDGDTGAPVATPTGGCTGVRAWTSPIAVKGRIVAGADGQLCSWSVH
jgi:hypothetical protein